jgi:predicted transglutaminase-like cysteine proteinase
MNQAQLQAVNAQVNAIPYNAIGTAPGANVTWIDAPAPGQEWECRDYSLAKAKALQQAGCPVTSMTLVECWIEPEPPLGNPQGAPVRQLHAVLAVHADDGTIQILDNRVPTIYDWRTPPYPYLWSHQQIPGSLEMRDASGANGLV